MNRNLESNLWKIFVYLLSQRRSFIPLLSIFFLTIPNTTIQQIGLFNAIGYLASFFFEIPSGYFSDTFGHKRTLILSKVLMICSVLSYIFATNFYYFVLGSILLSLSIAFQSGTVSAFVHDTLESLGREKEFGKIKGKLSANASLFSAFLILSLPFLTVIDFMLPFKVTLFFDIIGLFVIFFLVSPKKERLTQEETKSLFDLFKEAKKIKFFSIAIFSGSIIGFSLAASPFRSVYLESVGLPIVFMGFAMGISRFVWFFVGHYIHKIEKYVSIKQHLFVEIFIFSFSYILVAFFSNPYFLLSIIALNLGYMWGRASYIDHHILNSYLADKNYKATLLSFKGQISSVIQFFLTFLIGYVMAYSYKLGHYILGISLFIILSWSYYFIRKH